MKYDKVDFYNRVFTLCQTAKATHKDTVINE